MSQLRPEEQQQQQNLRDVERDDPEALSEDLSPNNEVSIDIVDIPPPRRLRRRDYWTTLLVGTIFTVGGMAGGAYAVRNFEQPNGWAVLFTSATLAGCYLTAKSLTEIFNLLNTRAGDTRDVETQRYRDLLNRHFGPLSWDTSDTGSFPPSPSVSEVSSDLLTLSRADYRPRSTDLSFRQKQEDRAKKYQKFVKKGWSSAPVLLGQRKKPPVAEKDKVEDDKGKKSL